jgi:hypothetical protein
MGRAVMQNESAIGLISATPEQPHLSYTQRPPPPLCFIYSFSVANMASYAICSEFDFGDS